jgi:hypothetical protein
VWFNGAQHEEDPGFYPQHWEGDGGQNGDMWMEASHKDSLNVPLFFNH